MELCLMVNVIHDRVFVRTADAECAVSLLPGKIDLMLAQPPRGVGFQHLNRLGAGMSGGSAINK
jgi:hypothetical protein